jgi:small GTP-binding protein
MNTSPLLNERQAQIREEERLLLARLLEVMQGWDTSQADREPVRQALHHLDELFLLVVVGEFNSGKSALINALLGEAYLPEGPTPTTDRVYILRHGQTAAPEFVQENIRSLHYPAEILRDLHIVDTPGTNAVLREHETIARDFVPRSDLVIFVTSADRPFTESERGFLHTIRQWGKKVVVVINRIDVLDSQQAVGEVEAFVRTQVHRLLDFEPDLFSLSARAGLRWVRGELPQADAGQAEGFLRFQDHLRRALTRESLVRVKLISPLGVARKVAGEVMARAQERRQVLADDTLALQQADHQLESYGRDTHEEYGRHLARIENDLLQMSLRGEAFLDDHMRLLKIADMLQSARMRAAFEREVVVDTPERLEAHVQEVIDWLVERELGLWRRTAEGLNRRRETNALQAAAHQAAGGFAYNRRELLEGLGRQAESVIRGYDRGAESRRLTEALQESVALVGAVEVGAIGLGLALKALLTTAAADATGLLAAGLLGVLGLAIIPYRRGVAKRDFRRKMESLRGQLADTLSESFSRELDRSMGRLREALAPYRRFVVDEAQRLESTIASLGEVVDQAGTLQSEIEAGPHPASS